MSNGTTASAKDRYLRALPASDELVARRIAEQSGIPSDDPTWLLLTEVQRATREASACTDSLRSATDAAVTRIERAATDGLAGGTTAHDFAAQIILAASPELAKNEQLQSTLFAAIRHIESDAVRALRAVETGVRDLLARRTFIPLASTMLALCVGVIATTFAVWQAYQVGTRAGEIAGYRAGYAYAVSHPGGPR